MKSYHNSYIFIKENAFENVVSKMAVILSQPCVNTISSYLSSCNITRLPLFTCMESLHVMMNKWECYNTDGVVQDFSNFSVSNGVLKSCAKLPIRCILWQSPQVYPWHLLYMCMYIFMYTSQLRIVHSVEEDNLSPFDWKIAGLCQSIENNNNKHVYRQSQVRKPISSEVKWAECLQV